MFSYFACGLAIQSQLALPELTDVKNIEAAPDVFIRLRAANETQGGGDGRTSFTGTVGEVRHFWQGVGTFTVRCGREIIVQPVAGVEERVLRLFLLGRVLGTLLHQRGFLVLHGSSVRINGGAVAFVGGKGWGKSTLAGAMYSAGHSVVADDIVALSVDGSVPTVFPGFPQLKVWPGAAAFLGHSVDALRRLHPEFEKLAWPVHSGFSQTPLPLKRIYVLDEGDQREIVVLPPKEAFVELVRHSYAVDLLSATGTAPFHFRQCAELVSSVLICRLKRTPFLEDLHDLALLVTENVIASTPEESKCAEMI